MDESYFGYRLLLLVFIVAFNALFASAEMALISVRQSRLRELAANGNVGAQAALSLLSKPERFLSTVQVGLTLAGLGAGWTGEETVYRLLLWLAAPLMTPGTQVLLHGFSFALSFLVLTFVMVVLGEVVPKNLGLKKSEAFAVAVAPAILVFYRLAVPFIFVLETASAWFSKLAGLRPEERNAAHSLEELKLIAKSIRASGRITRFEEEVVVQALELSEISVREVMVPRNAVASLPVDASLEEVLRIFADEQHARMPVYQDRPENIIGILHYKDLLPALRRLLTTRNPAAVPFRLHSLLRKRLVVPESKPLSQMIDEFRHHRAHMAMVVDEFGTIVGLVTLEDVLEQVFGEIEDEHDVSEHKPPHEAERLDLDGTVSIRDLESQYGIELPTNAGFETLAGFLLFKLGYIPKAAEVVLHDGWRFTILEMDGNRIARVHVEKTPEPARTQGADGNS
jgi:putative hemolysin